MLISFQFVTCVLTLHKFFVGISYLVVYHSLLGEGMNSLILYKQCFHTTEQLNLPTSNWSKVFSRQYSPLLLLYKLVFSIFPSCTQFHQNKMLNMLLFNWNASNNFGGKSRKQNSTIKINMSFLDLRRNEYLRGT